MLSLPALKDRLQEVSGRLDRLLLLLAYLGKPVALHEVRDLAVQCGLKIPKTWNLSDTLGKSGGKAIKIPQGWELSARGKEHARQLIGDPRSSAAKEVSAELRGLLEKIGDSQTKAFVEEAIECHELGLHRAAVVMSWSGAIYVLQKHVVDHQLAAFNAEALRIDQKWKAAKTTDDLARMKEKDFLDRLDAISVLGKNVKTELKTCLDLRNACGHPNSQKIGANTVARHLEQLLENVFDVYV